MLINSANLTILNTSFRVLFREGFDAAPSIVSRFCTEVPSTTSEEKYGWLGETTTFREWLGDRVLQNLETHDYSIKNRDFENTVTVPRTKIEDDQYGIYNPIMRQLGQDAKEHPDVLWSQLLRSSASTVCYDGQYYFDTDHVGYDENRKEISAANFVDGSGPAWYLFDTSKVLKPFILQKRKNYEFISLTKPTDPNVFHQKQYVYGVDGRLNVGFGLWQLAFCSKQPLTPDNYGAARAAMGSIRRQNGLPWNINPDVLVVPPSLEGAANLITMAEYIANTTNIWKGTAEVVKTAWVM